MSPYYGAKGNGLITGCLLNIRRSGRWRKCQYNVNSISYS